MRCVTGPPPTVNSPTIENGTIRTLAQATVKSAFTNPLPRSTGTTDTECSNKHEFDTAKTGLVVVAQSKELW